MGILVVVLFIFFVREAVCVCVCQKCLFLLLLLLLCRFCNYAVVLLLFKYVYKCVLRCNVHLPCLSSSLFHFQFKAALKEILEFHGGSERENQYCQILFLFISHKR